MDLWATCWPIRRSNSLIHLVWFRNACIILLITLKFQNTLIKWFFFVFADILKDSIKPYRDTDSGRFATAVVFDCRGLEPIDFSPRVSTTHPAEINILYIYLEWMPTRWNKNLSDKIIPNKIIFLHLTWIGFENPKVSIQTDNFCMTVVRWDTVWYSSVHLSGLFAL